MKVPATCETDRQEVRLEEHQKSIKEERELQGSNTTMTVDGLTDAALMGALHDTVQRYGGQSSRSNMGTWISGYCELKS